MEFSHIEIKSIPDEKGQPSIFSELYIDGQKMKGVRSINLAIEPNEIPKLTVDLNAFDISISQKLLVLQKGFGELSIKGELPEGSPSH